MEYASTSKHINNKASEAAAQQIAKLQSLVSSLENQGDKIAADPELRYALVRIAQALGIDPFHLQLRPPIPHELENRIAVAVVEACEDARAQNGGGGSLLLPQLAEKVTQRLQMRTTVEQVRAALAELSAFGPGLHLETLPNGTEVVRNAAKELSNDQGSVLAACDALGYVTSEMLVDNLNWDAWRSDSVLDDMVRAGLLWVDLQSAPTHYWTPSVI